MLKFDAVVSRLPADSAAATPKLRQVIEQAEQAIAEGRDAVQGLRASTLLTNALANELESIGRELAAAAPQAGAPQFALTVNGDTRDLVALVRDEVLRIAREAMRNAFAHAQASRIEAQIDYGRRRFELQVRDDGTGIAADVLSQGERPGHYGLRGMHERAQLIGGTLVIRGVNPQGAEISLSIPAARAYLRARGGSTL